MLIPQVSGAGGMTGKTKIKATKATKATGTGGQGGYGNVTKPLPYEPPNTPKIYIFRKTWRGMVLYVSDARAKRLGIEPWKASKEEAHQFNDKYEIYKEMLQEVKKNYPEALI